MKISTKGRYSLKVMLYLANRYKDNEYISLNKIAKDEGISLKYLERLISVLNKKDFFLSSRGVDGGYKLKNDPSKYTIGDILKTAEGSLSPVSCLEHDFICPNSKNCKTFKIWKDLNDAINNHLNNVTLKDYMEVK